MTGRVILPDEAGWEMLIRGRDAMIERIEDDDIDISTDDANACYNAMLAASPNAGKVSEAQFEKTYEAAKTAIMKCMQAYFEDCDCDEFACKEGVRATLASIGLTVANHEGKE